MSKRFKSETRVNESGVVDIYCRGCDTWKSESDYHVDTRRKTGRVSKCRKCINAYLKIRNDNKPKARDEYNKIIKDHGDWLEVDVSTTKFPNTIMKIDTEDWMSIKNNPSYGKVFARQPHEDRYLYAACNETVGKSKYKMKQIHRIIHPEWEMADHINLVGISTGLDNRKSNLRESTPIHNANNRHVRNSGDNQADSGEIDVSKYRFKTYAKDLLLAGKITKNELYLLVKLIKAELNPDI